MLGLAGVTDMEVRVAEVTVRVVLPEIVPRVAVMVAGVALATRAVAKPLLLMAATVGAEELQVAWVVISKVVPSEYVPEALNCWVAPASMLGLAGVTDMEVRVAGVTVRVVLPEIAPEKINEVAVMVAVPRAIAVAWPLPSTVTTDVLDELQTTCGVISKLVPSEKIPKAVNGWVSPAGISGLAGSISMEARVARFTERFALPETVPKVAVMVVPVGLTTKAVARPLLSIVAILGIDELQVTCEVMSKLVPSAKAPVATNCWVIPTGIFALTGVTDMEDRVEEITVRVVVPMEGPEEKLLGVLEVAVMVVIPGEMAVARPLLLIVATSGLDEVQVTWAVISLLVWSL